MSETSDYDPGPWKGHDFKSARKVYDDYAGRSYNDAVNSRVVADDLVPDSVTTDCKSPLIILSDVTGSMGEWPATMFSKLPYLDIEGKQYLGEGMEICFGAVGDANTDKYPLQIRPFTKGLDLKKQLTSLIIEGNGGGQGMESYELAALYAARNIKTPNAIRRPIIIFIGDEAPYGRIDSAFAKRYAHTLINESISDKDAFNELMENNSVYLVHKPYSRTSEEPGIKRHWISLLGEDRVADLPDANRIVDVIFGILAKEVNQIDYFHKEIEDRQTADQVNTVYRSLATIHSAAEKHTGRSIMLKPSGGGRSRSLLED